MRNLLIVFVFFFVCSGFAREIKIEGKVRDANAYSAIQRVNIYVQDSPEGTTSGSDGTFKLIINNPTENTILIFEHIAFDTLFVELPDALEMDDFYLQPRIIQFPKITVEAQREQPDIAKDIPQSIAIVEAKRFEVQGYVDAGDLLKTDQSIQIDENISGEKNISIRAGNAEDVIILYNGIKMNDVYDNRFDLSLINLEAIRQIQIIKGSNTVNSAQRYIQSPRHVTQNIFGQVSILSVDVLEHRNYCRPLGIMRSNGLLKCLSIFFV